MDTIEMLKTLRRETSKAVTRIDAEIARTLVKRARKYGTTVKEADVIKVVAAWKLAARKTKRLE